jgi:nucleoside-diphosphate-sugar epimerase
MKALITGGAGTMGRSLVKELLNHDFTVRVLDKNAERLKEITSPSLELTSGGIEDTATVKRAVSDAEVIYHLADTFSSDPYEVLDIDIRGNLNLLNAASELGIRHFIFTSTHRVYGRPRYLPIDEEHPLHPDESGRAVYGAAKTANEKLCLAFWRGQKLPVTIFRPWWSFSPNIRGKILRNMIDAALSGLPLNVPERTGGNFVHNDDAALAFRLAARNEAAYGEAFNLTSGVFVTWRELAEMVLELTGSSSELKFITEKDCRQDPLAGVDPSVYYECRLDISKAKRLIGYWPRHEPARLMELLRETVGRLVQSWKKP